MDRNKTHNRMKKRGSCLSIHDTNENLESEKQKRTKSVLYY